MSPLTSYEQALQQHQSSLEALLQKRTRLGWLRLFVFLITIAVAYFVFVNAGAWGFVPVTIGIAVLLALVSLDVNNNGSIAQARVLISINEEEIRLLQHDFRQRFDGQPFMPADHVYANDLDLFGPASLYQWMNRCATEQGRQQLASELLHPLPVATIERRQPAVKELAPLLSWRQQLQAYAVQTTITEATARRTATWLEEKEKHFTAKGWKWLVPVYSFISLGSALATILGIIPVSVFTTLFTFYLLFSLFLSRNTVQPYIHLSGIVKEINTLQQLVAIIEARSFDSPHINAMKAAAGEAAAGEIRQLRRILDRFDIRLNIVGLLFFNSFLLWDVRQMIALNEWRRRNRGRVTHWFALIAEMEVLQTLAAIHFSHPSWTFPQFVDKHATVNGTAIGHPLLPEGSRVSNDYATEGAPAIGLITGSNMAGKSTFLRSLGVNIVLAQIGAPVCAARFTLSPVKLMSSMRIADNLAENTSTFYAELKKLKSIIEAVNRGEPLYILLDEILRGTNSLDRHTGSAALIRQLIRQKAVAVIATHDVALASLENEYSGVMKNYHFDVQVSGEELYFDYKLKPGVCTSLNASLLMKKIGIEMS